MPANTFSILLGSATNDPKSVAAEINATVTSKEDFKAARKDISPASLEHLDIVVNSQDLGLFDPMELAGWAGCLHEGATVSIKVSGDASAANVQPIHSSFLLAGLRGAAEKKEADHFATHWKLIFMFELLACLCVQNRTIRFLFSGKIQLQL
jgi:hypothetical protein